MTKMSEEELVQWADEYRETHEGVGLSDVGVYIVREVYRRAKEAEVKSKHWPLNQQFRPDVLTRKHYVYYDDNFYAVGCNETGDIIDVFPDKAQAIKAIIDFEKSDAVDGSSPPGI